MKVIGKLVIEPTMIVRETSYSVNDLGKHASTMELIASDSDYLIEWDIPSLDTTVHIGLQFEHLELYDYDGVFSLPSQAIQLIRNCGFVVPNKFEDSKNGE